VFGGEPHSVDLSAAILHSFFDISADCQHFTQCVVDYSDPAQPDDKFSGGKIAITFGHDTGQFFFVTGD
jgi:hypothetical protein